MALNIGSNMPISQGYSQSGQSSGSVNSAESYNNSFNEGWSTSASGTDAATARMWSALAAEQAWMRDMYAYQAQMDFNRQEAEKQRQWQADMANTIYTRSVKNMREAGINPILAANMGLSGANVGSGATASISGAPSAPLAQNFMDSWSASEAYNHGSGEGASWGNGSSWGSGWSNSEEGIVTALEALGGMAGSALSGINAGNTLESLNNYLGNQYAPSNFGQKIGKSIRESVMNGVQSITNKIKDGLENITNHNKSQFNGGGGGHGFNKKMKN